MERISINTPLTIDIIKTLKAGDLVSITGTIYTARDAAHKRLVSMLEKNEKLPIEPNSIIYYAGPSPAKPGEVIGSIGPTTSTRMDAYSPRLIEYGITAMIGKGKRSDEVVQAIVKHSGIYFSAIGGAAALMARTVKKVEVIAFEDLGTEAIRKLEVVDMPVIVTLDFKGSNAQTCV